MKGRVQQRGMLGNRDSDPPALCDAYPVVFQSVLLDHAGRCLNKYPPPLLWACHRVDLSPSMRIDGCTDVNIRNRACAVCATSRVCEYSNRPRSFHIHTRMDMNKCRTHTNIHTEIVGLDTAQRWLMLGSGLACTCIFRSALHEGCHIYLYFIAYILL